MVSSILENIFLLIFETSKSKEPTTPEEYANHIKFNRMKKNLLRSGILRVGQPKKMWGPFEDKPKVLKLPTTPGISLPSMPKINQHPVASTLQPSIPRQDFKPTSNQSPNTPVGLPKPISTPGEVLKKVIKLTNGMKNAIKGYTCKECGFPVIKYKGSYPKNCINCEKPLVKEPIIRK